MLNENLLESSTKILYSVKHLSGLKVYWSRFLSFSFSSLTQAQIQQREITAASKPFSNQENLFSFFKSLPEDDQVWIIASFKLLLEQALKANDWITHRNLTLLLDQLSLQIPFNLIEEKFKQLQLDFSTFESRKVFFVNASIVVISFDYILRWLLLMVANSYSFMRGAIFSFNFFIEIPVLGFAYWYFRQDRKNNKRIVTANFFSPYHVKYKYSSFQYTVIGFYLISSLVTSFLLVDFLGVGIFAVAIALIAYYLILLSFFPIGRLTEYDFLQQVHSEKELATDADSNDEAIVMLETRLNSSTGRLEAYVLESALFGALAFSGFLQIIATDLISFSDLEKFASNCHQVAQSLILAKWDQFLIFFNQLNDKKSLFCLVSIETLVCSALFLAVIASRLRFSDVADKTRTALNLAKAYNEKEEAVIENTFHDENSGLRLAMLNKKINEHLVEAQRHLNGVDPIVSYMVYFRNAGLLSFLAVLVSSSLFVSSFLGWSFIAIGVATLIYFNLKSIRQGFISFGLGFRIFFNRYSWLLFVAALFPGVFGFVLRVAWQWADTDFLVTMSFALVGVYFFVWLVLMPHPDARFGDIENLQNEAWRSSSWRIIKNIYGVLVLICFAGFSFKSFHLNGANEMMIIALSGLSITHYFIGFYLTRPKWLGFLVAIILGTSGMGLLFKLQHWKGANEMIMIASALIPIFYVLFLLRRKSFHYILFRIFILFSIFTLSMSPVFFEPVLLRRIQLMYGHRTMAIENIINMNRKIQFEFSPDKVNPEDLELSLKNCDEYIQTYGTKYGWTEIYAQAFGFYSDLASSISALAKEDTLSLNIALKAARQANKINFLFNEYDSNVFLEAETLHALGRNEEAKSFLQAISKRFPTEGLEKKVNEELKKLDN